MVTTLGRVRGSIVEADSRIAEACRQLPGYESIVSIPGIGPAVAAVVLASIGDPHRFTSAKQVLKLAGLDLSASRSGKNSARVTPKLSKKGKAPLRYALYQAAVIATSRNKNFIEERGDVSARIFVELASPQNFRNVFSARRPRVTTLRPSGPRGGQSRGSH